VGWFLAGVRSGNLPGAVPEPERLTGIRLAESYIRNAGLYLPTEAELLDELFGRHGSLRAFADDGELRARMLECWRQARRVPDIPWPRVRQQAYADSPAAMRPA
jgi:hypothetical protein